MSKKFLVFSNELIDKVIEISYPNYLLFNIGKLFSGLDRTKRTEILYIFFGIHTANVVQLADRIEQMARLAAA